MTYISVLAKTMLAECERDGQSAHALDDEAASSALRAELRRLARSTDLSIRTAWLDGVVLLARLDAEVWTDDAASMRAKFVPQDHAPLG